ncbi:MAG: CDP-diacylglycerol--glycerol-3-phosphate 3-phosphatidyltransferase [Spirochaetia bacterium]
MNYPNLITGLRIAFSPVFFIVFFIPIWFGTGGQVSVVILWALFIVIETTDFIDGGVARYLDQVTDLGKLFDPFADVIARITYFTCFQAIGIMPLWAFLIILYRELGIAFVRLLMLKRGITLAARVGGKLKAVIYAVSGILGMLFITVTRFSLFQAYWNVFEQAVYWVFVLAALASLSSFIDYLLVLRRAMKKT